MIAFMPAYFFSFLAEFISYFTSVLGILFLFALFAVIHSVLASTKVKKAALAKLGDKMAFYRLLYNLFSILLFYIIFELMPGPYDIIYDLPAPFDIIVLVPQFLGLAGFLFTLKYFSAMEFLGIEQIIRWKQGKYKNSDLDEILTLKIEGPFKFVRHPLYFFLIVFLLFRPSMDLFYMTLFICFTLYFYVGSIYEERKLVETFGDEYRIYQQKVPRLIPYKLFSPYIK